MEIGELGPTLWLLMTLGGAALLGVGIAYAMISTRKRRQNPVAQRVTDQGTRDLYRAEEVRREREEEPAEAPPRQVP